MRLRFQADADLDGRVIRGLRRAAPAVDIRTASDSGLEGLADPQVLRAAADANRVLISQDRQTMPRHFREFCQMQRSPGVILLRRGIRIASAVEEIVLIWSASNSDEWTNRLIWIPL